MSFPLNTEQRAVIDAMHAFLKSKEMFFVLKGQAGVGKSSCIQIFAKESGVEICLTAPTNKATRVLQELAMKIGDDSVQTKTIYSLLGLKLGNDNAIRRVKAEGRNIAEFFKVVVIDEGSMVSEELMAHIRSSALEFNVKFIFLYDPFQLPPVGEEESPVCSMPNQYELHQVMRHDNQILTLATKIRKAIEFRGPLPLITSDNDENGGVYAINRKAFMNQIAKGFTSDAYQEDSGAFRILSWRNAMVGDYNEFVRRALYGDKADDGPFQVGERIIVCQPIMGDAEEGALMTTDEEAEVMAVTVENHPVYSKFLMYHVEVLPDYSREWVSTWVVHEDSRRDLERFQQRLAENAREKKGSWAEFWTCKEMIHDVRPCHAMTIHRSQGSTFRSVFVNAPDILSNGNRLESLKCLYVGFTRPQKNLIIVK